MRLFFVCERYFPKTTICQSTISTLESKSYREAFSDTKKENP